MDEWPDAPHGSAEEMVALCARLRAHLENEERLGRCPLMDDAREKRINELKERIEDLTARLPKHSVPAAMLIELEDLEEELEELEAGGSTSLR